LTQEVEVPGVGRLQFPDGMSHQDMANAIKHNYPDIHKNPPSETELHIGVQRGPEKTTLGTPGQLGGFAFDVATAGLGGGIGSKVAKPIAEHMMAKAISPSTVLSVREAENVINTALKEGINATKGGIGKINGLIRDLGGKVKDVLSKSDKKVNPNEILKDLNSPAAKSEFKKIRMMYKGQEIPIQALQEFKQKLSTRLPESMYRDIKKMGIGELAEGRRELQSVLRKKIAELEPHVSEPNQKMHELFNLKEQLEPQVVRGMKKTIGPGTMSAGARAARPLGTTIGAGIGAGAGEIGQRALSETPDR
jgi:hypothetical protein